MLWEQLDNLDTEERLRAIKRSNREFMQFFRAEVERINNRPYKKTLEFAKSQVRKISNTELEKLLFSPRSEWQKKAEQLEVDIWHIGGRLFEYCYDDTFGLNQFKNIYFPQITITCQSNYKKHREHGKEKRKLATFKCAPLGLDESVDLTGLENVRNHACTLPECRYLDYLYFAGMYSPELRNSLYYKTLFPSWECLAVARSREYKNLENQHYEEWAKTIQGYTDKLLYRLGWHLIDREENNYYCLTSETQNFEELLLEAPPFDIAETDLRNVLEKAGFSKLLNPNLWKDFTSKGINYCERLIKALADIGYTYQPKYLPYYYVRDPERPKTGYQYPKYEQNSSGLITAYYFKCPCGYKIKKIDTNRLNPILDKLAFNGVKEIPIQNIIKYL